jgi:hypothetical protein
LLKASPPKAYALLDPGHAVQELKSAFDQIEPELATKLQQYPLPGAPLEDGFILVVFPDLAVTLRSNVVSVDCAIPLGVEESVLESRVLGLRGDSEDVRALRMLSWETWFNNPVQYEDHPIFEIQQRGLRGGAVRYSFIGRGADATRGTRGDDNRLRHFWAAWRQYMGVERNSID